MASALEMYVDGDATCHSTVNGISLEALKFITAFLKEAGHVQVPISPSYMVFPPIADVPLGPSLQAYARFQTCMVPLKMFALTITLRRGELHAWAISGAR